MTKATNIREVHKVFIPKPLTLEDGKEFYVDIYKEDLEKLGIDLELNDDFSKTFYVTGQSGNGKTTALNFLSNNNDPINDKYKIITIPGKDLFNMEDVDIIDVLIMIGLRVVQGTSLESKFIDELTKLRDVKAKKLEDVEEKVIDNTLSAGANIQAGISAKVGFLSFLNSKISANSLLEMKINNNSRDFMRRVFTVDMMDLIDLINKIILDYKKDCLGDKERLLIIIDDLEKISNFDQIKKLFVTNSYVMDKVECEKILTFPIHLCTTQAMFKDAYKFGIRVNKNPLGEQGGDTIVASNKAKLRDSILSRIEDASLFEEEAISRIVELSGGNVDSLVDLCQKSARFALMNNREADEITLHDVDRAKDEIAQIPAMAIQGKLNMLSDIIENFMYPEVDNEKFIDALLENSVYVYFNGKTWYDVNPIVKDLVKGYLEQRKE